MLRPMTNTFVRASHGRIDHLLDARNQDSEGRDDHAPGRWFMIWSIASPTTCSDGV